MRNKEWQIAVRICNWTEFYDNQKRENCFVSVTSFGCSDCLLFRAADKYFSKKVVNDERLDKQYGGGNQLV